MNYLDPNPCLRVSVGALQTKTGVFPALSQLFLGQKVKVLLKHLILCLLLLLLPSIFVIIKVFSNEVTLHIRWPKY